MVPVNHLGLGIAAISDYAGVSVQQIFDSLDRLNEAKVKMLVKSFTGSMLQLN